MNPPPPFETSPRMPDPRVQVLDERFRPVRLLAAGVERLATGFSWTEGPQWFGDGRFLLFSDIPGNRILRWDACSGQTHAFRQPSHHANGLARDTRGRLVSCEHGSRRVTRTEHDGRITVLAERFQGRPLNSPNDIVCRRTDGSLWFTDPPFGIGGWYEGLPATPELPHGVYRIDAEGHGLELLLDDLQGPNGLAFSPDERHLYVVESRHRPHRRIWRYAVEGDGAGTRLVDKRLFADAQGPGAYDGIAVDEAGRVWCGFGSDGSAGAEPEALDGVRVHGADGTLLAHIALPERCANLCFGGERHNRLFMAAGRSLYALFVNTRGAVRD